MKIVYFGSDVFLNVFRYFMQTQEILALYTYHNEEDYFNENSIVRLAHMMGIPVHYEQADEAAMTRWIKEDGCELFFVAEYSHKLPVPPCPEFRGINIHSSLLPEGPSYYPIECAMDQQLGYGGVTLHKLFSQLDRGDILAQQRFPVGPEDDSVDVYLNGARIAEELVRKIFVNFDESWQKAVPQVEKLPYWKRPDLSHMTLRHDMTLAGAREIYRRFNKMTQVDIDGVSFYVDSFQTGTAPIGKTDEEIIFIRENRILYGVEDGHLRLDIQTAPVI